MGVGLKAGGGPRGMGTMFWILISIIAVGLALMIYVPLVGR